MGKEYQIQLKNKYPEELYRRWLFESKVIQSIEHGDSFRMDETMRYINRMDELVKSLRCRLTQIEKGNPDLEDIRKKFYKECYNPEYFTKGKPKDACGPKDIFDFFLPYLKNKL